jgi:hypothetical protein
MTAVIIALVFVAVAGIALLGDLVVRGHFGWIFRPR